jgi:hypothetical protein
MLKSSIYTTVEGDWAPHYSPSLERNYCISRLHLENGLNDKIRLKTDPNGSYYKSSWQCTEHPSLRVAGQWNPKLLKDLPILGLSILVHKAMNQAEITQGIFGQHLIWRSPEC